MLMRSEGEYTRWAEMGGVAENNCPLVQAFTVWLVLLSGVKRWAVGGMSGWLAGWLAG